MTKEHPRCLTGCEACGELRRLKRNLQSLSSCWTIFITIASVCIAEKRSEETLAAVVTELRMAGRSFGCPAFSASILPSITLQRLMSVECARAANVWQRAMSMCWRPGTRKRHSAILVLSVQSRTSQRWRGRCSSPRLLPPEPLQVLGSGDDTAI